MITKFKIYENKTLKTCKLEDFIDNYPDGITMFRYDIRKYNKYKEETLGILESIFLNNYIELEYKRSIYD